MANKYGLSRDIPAKVRREVRKRDGFGCIFCRVPIIDYEHVDPPYVDAKEHKADSITLLCPTCHRKVTGNQISKDLVKKAMANPAARQAGAVGDKIFFCDTHPTVTLGGAKFVRCNIPLKYNEEDIIAINEEDGKYLLNAKLWDSDGNQTLTIKNNEWQVSTDKIWDLTVIGNTINIHEGARSPSLIIRVINNNEFIIERIEMIINNFKISGNQETLTINNNKIIAMHSTDSYIGIYLHVPKCS